ncbi:hypothetical protein EDD22DRAFT_954350 [Suillus occidentalis]|nr:hypothetical protein EDD22DRAFT_954350 [Suillus occidentalis]
MKSHRYLIPPIRGIHPSLTLKATNLQPCDTHESSLLNIVRTTDAGHVQFATYVTNKTVSHLNDAVQIFTALTNFAWARLQDYIRKDIQDIDAITSLSREALALRPQGHLDHPLFIYHLTEVLTWRCSKERTAIYIHESAQLSCKLLPLCPEGTYLHDIVAGDNGASTPDELYSSSALWVTGNEHRHTALHELAQAKERCFQQHGSIDDLDECIQCRCEAVSLCIEGQSEHFVYLNNLALSLTSRFEHQGNLDDLKEAISLYEEALRLRPVGHNSRRFSLDNLGLALRIRFQTW